MNEVPMAVTDSIQISKVTRKKALIIRVGGLGDILILSPIAKELDKRGFIVDCFFGSPTGQVFEFFQGLPYINDVKEVTRIPSGVDCIKIDEDYISIEILKANYDEVYDYKFSIEDNRAGLNGQKGWRGSINSNYQNWIDLSLSWANIDPTKIKSEDKRPEISLHYKEQKVGELNKYSEWIQDETPIKPKFNHADSTYNRNHCVIGIQLQASTLIRTWYKAGELPLMIHEKYPDDIVLIFADKDWFALSKFGKRKLSIPDDYNRLMCSAALINEMNVFIAADSGMSHIAEALSIPTIGIYTTVPSWTRTKDYKFAHSIDATVECHPCFTLNVFCPLEELKAKSLLNEREKKIFDAGESGADIGTTAKIFDTVPKAIFEEYASIKQKLQAQSATQPACVGSITPEIIMTKLSEVLNEQSV